MIKRPFLAALAALSLSGALVASLVTASPASARPMKPGDPVPSGTVIPAAMFGQHVMNLEYGNWPTIPIGSVRLWDNQTSWSSIEKAQGNFDWTNLDTAVATAQKNGVNDFLMVLAGTPAWASDDMSAGGVAGVLPGGAGMPRDFSWWDNWVRQVATRYKGKINNYQVWNEANLSTFSTGSPEEMADLTKRAYDIIKQVDPGATVVAPSTGTRLGGPFKKFYEPYLQALKAKGWPIDVFAAHTYPSALGQTKDRAKLAKDYTTMLKKYGAPDKPIWDTENNFGLAGPGSANPEQDIVGQTAADWVGETYLDALRLGFSRVYWYRWTTGEDDMWGIQMYNGTPGAIAFKTLEDWIVGATFKGCTNKKGAVTCNFTKNGSAFRVVYSDTNSPKSFAVSGAAQACKLDGTCSAPSGGTIATSGPVKLG